MCGIVGAIRAQDNVVDFLTDGLKRLEYRGYDSSGIAVQTDEGLKRVRRVGRVALMEAAAKELDFLQAAKLRDELGALKQALKGKRD